MTAVIVSPPPHIAGGSFTVPNKPPLLILGRNNTGRLHIAVTEYDGDLPTHTQVLSRQDSAMVDQIMLNRWDTMRRISPNCDFIDETGLTAQTGATP